MIFHDAETFSTMRVTIMTDEREPKVDWEQVAARSGLTAEGASLERLAEAEKNAGEALLGLLHTLQEELRRLREAGDD